MSMNHLIYKAKTNRRIYKKSAGKFLSVTNNRSQSAVYIVDPCRESLILCPRNFRKGRKDWITQAPVYIDKEEHNPNISIDRILYE